MLLIYLFALTGGITKWHTVVNTADAQLRFAESAQCYTSGLFGALFLPSIVGGDVARLAVGISHSPRPAAVITGNVADRFLDVAAQLTLVHHRGRTPGGIDGISFAAGGKSRATLLAFL